MTTKQNAGASAVGIVSSVAYQPMTGLVQSLTYGNGLTEQNTFTLDHELGRCEVRDGATALIDVSYGRTDNLNLTAITDAVVTANNQSFAYSNANRMSTAAGAYGSLSWSYDGVGNRTQEIATPVGGSATTRTFAYPAASNRLDTVTIGAGTERAFTYDGAGNILTDARSGTAYAYNSRNRLATLTVAGSLRATYTYNGLEQLASRVLTNMTPSGTTHFLHDRAGNVIAETDGSGPAGTVREYIWLPATNSATREGIRTSQRLLARCVSSLPRLELKWRLLLICQFHHRLPNKASPAGSACDRHNRENATA